MDTNNDLELASNVPTNLSLTNNIASKLDSSAEIGLKLQATPQSKSNSYPYVYLKAPTKIPLVTMSTPNSTNVYVKTLPPMQFPNLSSTISSKPISSMTVHPNPSVLLSNPNSALKSPQILIQKSGSAPNTYLTMLKPISNLGNYGESAQANSIHITATTSSFIQSTMGSKYVLTSMPKLVSNSPQTLTTNRVQPNLAFIQPTATETPVTNFKVINPLLNFTIADGRLQTKSNNSPITVMCDSNSFSSSSDTSNDNKLICTEVIDLDSPTKDDQLIDNDNALSCTPEGSDNKYLQQSTDKFSHHGVSILKKNFSIGRESIQKNHRTTSKPASISDLTIPKDVMVTKPSTGTAEKIIISESKVTSRVSQKSGRRKSSFSLRKDFDDIAIEIFDDGDVLQKTFEDTDISLTKAENLESISVDRNEEDDIEIKIIEDNIETTDINMNDYMVNFQKLINWDSKLGGLPGSDVKFIINEFDMLEYISKSEYDKVTEEKNNKLKDKPKDNFQEEMRCIECGCFGLPSDFFSPKYCSFDCQDAGKQKSNKEKDVKYKKRKRGAVRKPEMEDKDDRDESESSDDNSSYENSRDRFSYPWSCAKKGFSWSKYLEFKKAKAAPTKLFKDPFPYNRNGFRPGMKLEGIDPLHPSYFCVLTVSEVLGYRMRLHFDGFSTNYDFWVNADSMDIFPVGWCEKYNHVLRPPPGYTEANFNWVHYLKDTKSVAAPKQLFANRAGNAICPNGFRVGMKLEAVDMKNNSSLICVATVRDMMDNRILVHFDSWDDIYDYWAEPTSPYIHPVGWSDQYSKRLTPPNDYPSPEEFSWEQYLRETKTVAAPVRAFKSKPACGFKRGMKLECVDKRVPRLIRVATVEDVRGHQIKIHFDGWLDKYSYWVEDDSTSIHPAGWCQKTGHPLEPPLTPDDVYDNLDCSTIGCKGQGHVLGGKLATHSSLKDCPYADENLSGDKKFPDRLLSPDRLVEAVVPVSREPKEKPRARVGRPPKYPRTEVKIDVKEDDYEDKKFVGKYKKIKLSFDHDIENRIMNFLQDTQVNPAERESWMRHSMFLNNYTEFKTDPRNWSSSQVANFIESLPTGSDYADVFKNQDIDGEALLLLSQRDIIEILNIKLGPAIKLYNSIRLLRQNLEKIIIKGK